MICQFCKIAPAKEAVLLIDDSVNALCLKCILQAEEFIVNVGCLT
jgi:hypothetical protein